MYKRSMERHRALLLKVTREWEEKARTHHEAARYWDISRLCARDNGDKAEEERVTRLYELSMSQAQEAINKLHVCQNMQRSLL